jgi:hypothetical protein
LKPGAEQVFAWQVPDTDSAPISEIGIEISSESRADGTIYLDYLTWRGEPVVTFRRTQAHGLMWKRAWVNALDHPARPEAEAKYPEAFRLIQNNGRGMLIQGTQEWQDYHVSAPLTAHMCKSMGIAARVQGLRRYYALLLCRDSTLRLVKVLDGETLLAEKAFPWEFGATHILALQVQGTHLICSIDGQTVFDIDDSQNPLLTGAIALVCEEGRVGCEQVTVRPVA